MHCNQPEQHPAEFEAPAQRDDQRHADDDPDHLHEPREAIVGAIADQISTAVISAIHNANSARPTTVTVKRVKVWSSWLR